MRKGEDAAKVIDGIVDAWATQLDEKPEYNECPGVTLDRVALIDGDTGEPIDLGDLLKRVAERIAGSVRKSDLIARLGGD
ncbi:MAG: hypothetical protein HRU13_09925, partial [Phycisphaerales bacterium]|nr:hypothetical protein [Phycisphaerales bacterium]